MKAKFLTLITFCAFALSAVLFVVAWRPLTHSSSPASNNVSLLMSNQSNPSTNIQRQVDQSTLGTNLKANNNGLTVEITQIDLNPEYPTITICADIPTVADWLPRISVSYKGETVEMADWMLLDPNNTAYMQSNRCYLVMLPPTEFTSGKMKISLDYFEMSMPERLPDDFIEKAKKNLKDKELDIDFEMKNVDHGQIIVIKKKPTDYTDEQTYQAIQEAIAEAPEKVYGPWAFVIDVKP